MITDEDKQRITEEEIFRVEVQKGLAYEKASQTRHKNVWSFLNTSLGIWVLSTIVIGVFAWSYSQAQSFQENNELVYKLDVEIESRLSNGERSVLLHRTMKDNKPFHMANVLLFPPDEERAVFPEFAHRNLKSLLYELDTSVPSTESVDIIDAISFCGVLEQAFLNQELQQDIEDSLMKEVSNIHKTRWVIAKIFREKATASKVRLFESVRDFIIECLLIVGLTLLANMFFIWRKRRKLDLDKV